MSETLIKKNKKVKTSQVFLAKKSWKKYWGLYLLLIPPIVYFVIFRYGPMVGNVLAFRRYVPGKSVLGTEWVGFRYFEFFLNDDKFWQVFKNTLVLSGLNLLIGFPIPIIFALMLNELKSSSFKRVIQTISYLPKFLSTVVVVTMINALLNPSTGIVNMIIRELGGEVVHFMGKPELFRVVYISSEIWQFLGWNAIIYIAALSGIDPQLYEAAVIDGANRWKQVIHVTLPGIMPTIIVLFILAVGQILNVGFEKVLLMYSPSTYDTADIIQTYVYRMAFAAKSHSNSFSMATAIGLFQGVISLILIWSANTFTRKVSDHSLW